MRIIALLLICHFVHVCASSQTALHKQRDGYCFRGTDWSIHGIGIADSAGRIDSLLGKPLRVKKVKEEDDGGDYVNEKRHYTYFDIDIVREIIDRIYTESSKVVMPSGIRVGLTLHSVLNKLNIGLENKPNKRGVLEFPSCSLGTDNEGLEISDDAWLLLSFDKANILKSIELLVNRL
jgi:hypothetical protein